jgi:hypothetical protein
MDNISVNNIKVSKMIIFTLMGLLALSSCNPIGESAFKENFFPGLKLEPKITSVSPIKGEYTGGTNITITGSGFGLGAQVKLGDSLCASVSFISETKLTCLTPANPAAVVSVTVINPDGKENSLLEGFSFTTASKSPGFSIVSGGSTKMSSQNLSLEATIGEPTGAGEMNSSRVKLRPNIRGVIFQ